MPVPRWAKEEFLADKERRAKGDPVAAERATVAPPSDDAAGEQSISPTICATWSASRSQLSVAAPTISLAWR